MHYRLGIGSTDGNCARPAKFLPQSNLHNRRSIHTQLLVFVRSYRDLLVKSAQVSKINQCVYGQAISTVSRFLALARGLGNAWCCEASEATDNITDQRINHAANPESIAFDSSYSALNVLARRECRWRQAGVAG